MLHLGQFSKIMALDQLYDLFIASLDKGILQNICLLKGGSKRGHFCDRVESRARAKVLFPTVPVLLEPGRGGGGMGWM